MNYQGKADKSKDNPQKEKPPLAKVVTGDVTVKKPSLGSRFKGIFLGGDAETAMGYVVSEVLLPAFRNLIVEAVSKGTDRLVYGDSAMRPRRPPMMGPRVQYHNPVMRDPRQRALLPDQRPADRWAPSVTKTFDEVIVSSKEEADAVVDTLTTVVDQYEVVSVADLHEVLGLSSSHVDNKWGWTHLVGIEVRQVREGYKISFPPLEEIA